LGHDLRNPLGAIIMGARLLTKAESLDDKHARVATRILNSADRMNRMVSDLLDLTRTRLGPGIPVTPKPMDLAPACQQVISELEALHPECELRFESKGDLRGEWDSDRLVQVLSNLVGNAVQYGCDGGVVNVAAQEQGEEVVLRVQNMGPRIPESKLRHIFDPMVRHATGDGKNSTGMGLGLYIAREVVTAHSGTISVTSTEKEGTTFTVRIPRRPLKTSTQTS
jgi:signal transduction histidine kinase